MSNDTSTSQRTKKRLMLVIFPVLLVMAVAMFPWLWTMRAKQKIAATITKKHGDTYAIIGLHVNGKEAREHYQFNMYERLYAYGKYLYSQEVSETFGYSHHCAILISDNKQVYRYYWSIREDKLMLDAQVPIPEQTKSLYQFDDATIEHKHGMRFKANVVGTDINWYFFVYQ